MFFWKKKSKKKTPIADKIEKEEEPATNTHLQEMEISGEKLIEKVKVEIEKLKDNIKSHNHSQKPDKDYNLLDINDIIDNKIILEENHG